MVTVQEGQCGVCAHFGELDRGHRLPAILEVLTTRQASETLTAPCTQEKHKGAHLRVTPVCGCDAFAPAR